MRPIAWPMSDSDEDHSASPSVFRRFSYTPLDSSPESPFQDVEKGDALDLIAEAQDEELEDACDNDQLGAERTTPHRIEHSRFCSVARFWHQRAKGVYVSPVAHPGNITQQLPPLSSSRHSSSSSHDSGTSHHSSSAADVTPMQSKTWSLRMTPTYECRPTSAAPASLWDVVSSPTPVRTVSLKLVNSCSPTLARSVSEKLADSCASAVPEDSDHGIATPSRSIAATPRELHALPTPSRSMAPWVTRRRGTATSRELQAATPSTSMVPPATPSTSKASQTPDSAASSNNVVSMATPEKSQHFDLDSPEDESWEAETKMELMLDLVNHLPCDIIDRITDRMQSARSMPTSTEGHDPSRPPSDVTIHADTSPTFVVLHCAWCSCRYAALGLMVVCFFVSVFVLGIIVGKSWHLSNSSNDLQNLEDGLTSMIKPSVVTDANSTSEYFQPSSWQITDYHGRDFSMSSSLAAGLGNDSAVKRRLLDPNAVRPSESSAVMGIQNLEDMFTFMMRPSVVTRATSTSKSSAWQVWGHRGRGVSISSTSAAGHGNDSAPKLRLSDRNAVLKSESCAQRVGYNNQSANACDSRGTRRRVTRQFQRASAGQAGNLTASQMPDAVQSPADTMHEEMPPNDPPSLSFEELADTFSCIIDGTCAPLEVRSNLQVHAPERIPPALQCIVDGTCFPLDVPSMRGSGHEWPPFPLEVPSMLQADPREQHAIQLPKLGSEAAEVSSPSKSSTSSVHESMLGDTHSQITRSQRFGNALVNVFNIDIMEAHWQEWLQLHQLHGGTKDNSEEAEVGGHRLGSTLVELYETDLSEERWQAWLELVDGEVIA